MNSARGGVRSSEGLGRMDVAGVAAITSAPLLIGVPEELKAALLTPLAERRPLHENLTNEID